MKMHVKLRQSPEPDNHRSCVTEKCNIKEKEKVTEASQLHLLGTAKSQLKAGAPSSSAKEASTIGFPIMPSAP